MSLIQERCDGGPRNETRECCTETNPCKEGQGDCDTDEECRGDLICGRNNCGSKFSWDSADCCEKSSKYMIAPNLSILYYYKKLKSRWSTIEYSLTFLP